MHDELFKSSRTTCRRSSRTTKDRIAAALG